MICIESGRVAFLLKNARSAKLHRSAPKEYKANLNLLVSPQDRDREHRHESNDAQEEEKHEDDMNVDSRHSNMQQNISQFRDNHSNDSYATPSRRSLRNLARLERRSK